MAVIEGYVEKIVYRNEENGYTVLTLVHKGEEVTCVGTFQYIGEGECLEAEGDYTAHPVYGEQLKISKYEIKAPEDITAIERYLASGAIKGIGTVMASRIVRRFKKDTFRIIEEEPERLTEIKGISQKKAMEIADQIQEKKDMRKAMIFLQGYGIGANLAVKIYNQYGPGLYTVLKQNPYRLADDIHGVGFRIADEIAAKVGIHADSDFRIKSGILYSLMQAAASGHVYLPLEELTAYTGSLLNLQIDSIEKHVMDLAIEKRIVLKEIEEKKLVYAAAYYYMELNSARLLYDLNIEEKVSEDAIKKRLDNIEQETGVELDNLQREAVIEAVKYGLLVITGGPGTGKTTTINAIIRYFESEQMEVLLAAPTGRAAKRMTEATGCEAKTIHRLLELNGGSREVASMAIFERNEQNPLEADVIIIDEMSMVDIGLMNSLLKAVSVGTRLILVGDVNQLPSVGPGNVLKDIIRSGAFPVVRLTKIFRQAGQSDIVLNAHKINKGEKVALDNNSKDFLFLKRDEANVIISVIITLIQKKLPHYVNAKELDIQVLTPMRKGQLGVERLNEILQQYLNPPSTEKKEKEQAGSLFREGDKVMQIKNNYQLEWEIRGKNGIVVDKGMGIFNGDTGIIKEINEFSEILTVEFDEGRFVEYSYKQLEELELAYAITIHKSQGSEYPAVILPLLTGPQMLMNRNLLYTAVTRAKKCVCLVGSKETFYEMAENQKEQKRYSGLCNRIQELVALDA
ncbi:MAG: ATP-dependent RecD-like DNA helicase [Lachnospiraceae bacterium]|nr:ATP-dependent RecD-like DNA helicase [Lachnospiraceae bacterium]